MTKATTALISAILLVLLAPVVGPAAATAKHSHLGETARHVAGEIGCKHFDPSGGIKVYRSGWCRLKGYRVDVITFKTGRQQRRWTKGAAKAFDTSFWWANGDGAVVVAEDGSKAAARVGKKRLPGTLERGTAAAS